MAKGFHHRPRRSASRRHERRTGVTEIMKTEPRRIRPGRHGVPGAVYVARFQRATRVSGKHEAAVLPCSTSRQPVGILPHPVCP